MLVDAGKHSDEIVNIVAHVRATIRNNAVGIDNNVKIGRIGINNSAFIPTSA